MENTLSGISQTIENKVFCTPSDVESGAYRDCFTVACFRTESIWKRIGLEAFIKEEQLTEYCRGWLEELEQEVSGKLPDDWFQGIKCSRSDKYPVILEYGNNTFCLQPVDWLATADEVYGFFRDLTEGYEQLLDSIEAEYPEVSLMLRMR